MPYDRIASHDVPSPAKTYHVIVDRRYGGPGVTVFARRSRFHYCCISAFCPVIMGPNQEDRTALSAVEVSLVTLPPVEAKPTEGGKG